MIIQSKNVWIEEQLTEKQIEIENGKIVGLYDYDEKKADKDYGESWILPGFIDVHTHGYHSVDANVPTEEGLKLWCQHNPHEGVTSFLVTTATQEHNEAMKAMKIIADFIEKDDYTGSEALGINMEGNFIGKECKGAQNESAIIGPNAEQLEEYYKQARGHLVDVCYAAELDENFKFLDKCKELGIVASIGHSAADYDTAIEAMNHGATSVTHTGNGMKPFHHRKPGLFGAAVCNDGVYAECIGDGFHVAFPTVHIIGKMKGKDHLVLITDSATQKDDPQYDALKTTGAYCLPNGTLFGSALYVNKGVSNLYEKADLPLVTAINAATINPARMLHVDDRKGSIAIGKDADLVICDEHIDLMDVYCRGLKQW